MSSTIIQILITVLGSGALFGFLQFLIQRKDTKEDKIDEILEKLNDGLQEQKSLSEDRYDNLKEELNRGLEERETTGRERYLEHKESIQKLNEAIFQLTKNDSEQSKYIKSVGSTLVGLSHDKILSLSDKFLERGGITLREKTTLKSIYDPYRELGGNGDCQVAYEQVDHLPIISEEKAKELDKKRT